MTTTREWKTQNPCLHCGKSEINHHPCVVAPGIWLCRPCANEISNPQLRQLREDTLQDLCNQGPVEFTMSSEDGFENPGQRVRGADAPRFLGNSPGTLPRGTVS